MIAHSRLARIAPALLGLAALALGAPAAAQDDTALFSTAVPPNVMLMVDNSGSMNEVMWHPDFEPELPTGCPIFEHLPPNDGSGPTEGSPSGTMNGMPYHCNGYCRFQIHSGLTGFVDTGNVSCPGGGSRDKGYIEKTFCGNTRKLYIDGDTACQGNATWYSEAYLEWYFSDHADPYFIGNETNTSTDVQMIDANNNGTHYVTGTQFALYKRSRITAAKEIARDVIYQVNSDCSAGDGFPCPNGSKDAVRFGIAQFDGTSGAPGGFVSAPIDNYSDNDEDLNDAVTALDAQTSTPLGETLFKLYTYFMSRTQADRPYGKDGVTRFPRYSYRTSDGANTNSPPPDPLSCPPSNTKCLCQKNFVILITDGTPSNDNFSTTGSGNGNTTGRTLGFGDFEARLIGDYHADGEDEDLGLDNGMLYLDDIAKFMQERDFRPDMDGMQTIDVYTVGFATGTTANALLQKTADVGNGLFFTGTQAQDLTDALVDAIQSIILKTQAFTAATVPATRTSYGGKFYNSVFRPSATNGYWEGELYSWTITEAGEILDDQGDCAFVGPPVPCFGGVFDPSADPHWSAADEVPAPASRKLYTSELGASDKVTFTAANMSAADLDLTLAERTLYDYTAPSVVPATVDVLAEMVVENVRGCEFGTGVGGVACELRTDSDGEVHLLGDIFHSNPVVVGRPVGYMPEPSYQQWQSPVGNPTVGQRQQVIVAGANDGLFRIFDAGLWVQNPTPPAPQGYTNGSGAEIAGFMPYTARRNVKRLARPSTTRDYYFTDGSPTVADVWFYDDPEVSAPEDKVANQWHTILVAGMRQGGNQYFALDITNPAAADYPGYLWEFPREDAPATITDYMGQTWSEPVITKIKMKVDGSSAQERWVAIFAGGYDPSGDPNTPFYDLQATAGRSLTILDLKTGEILARKRFDATGVPAGDDPTAVTYDADEPERSMVFAIASTPGVYDLNGDGFADTVYVGDLGGNIWKWVISDAGVDIVNGSPGPEGEDQAWHFEKFFAAPVHTHSVTGVKHYRSFYFFPSATVKSGVLWLAIGSGERADLKFAGYPAPEDENNRFYAIKDLDPYERGTQTPVMTETNLFDITGALGSDSSASVAAFDGWMYRAADGEKFVTATDIFFYYVFAATFTPTTSADPCSSGGSATLYAFRIYSGEGLFDDGAGNPVATIDLGDGMPTNPEVSLSGADGGSRVFINKKDEVISIDTGFTLDLPAGIATWEEMY